MDKKLKQTLEILLKEAIQEMLDDPAGAITSEWGIAEWVQRLQAVAKFLGLDWNTLLQNEGSEFERNRLQWLVENPSA